MCSYVTNARTLIIVDRVGNICRVPASPSTPSAIDIVATGGIAERVRSNLRYAVRASDSGLLDRSRTTVRHRHQLTEPPLN